MRSRRPTTEHQDAVARRLAQLSAEPPPPYSMEPTHTRVRVGSAARVAVETPWEPDDEYDDEGAEAGPVPMPGRHASRRVGQTLVGAVPDTLRGRVALGPAQLTLVAVLVAIGLAATTWWVVRGDPREVAAPVVAESPAGLATPAEPVAAVSPGAPTAGGAAERVTVDVAGKVRRPGIVVLDPGARVIDALEAAGGARPRVDLSALNLARVLVDGEQVLVGLPPPAGASAATGGTAAPLPGALVNLNTATTTELEALPEVGPVTAGAIIAWRDEHGGFTAVEELLEVDGIGDATLATIAPHVTV